MAFTIAAATLLGYGAVKTICAPSLTTLRISVHFQNEINKADTIQKLHKLNEDYTLCKKLLKAQTALLGVYGVFDTHARCMYDDKKVTVIIDIKHTGTLKWSSVGILNYFGCQSSVIEVS